MKVLLYSHDGRGAGHISRTVALANAIKRKHLDWKVLCVTGGNSFSTLNKNDSIDWVKLPSYKTVVEKGHVRAKLGPLGYGKMELAKMRSKILLNVAKTFSPDLLIVEYFPKGKLDEMEKAVEWLKKNTSCRMFLGLRGVISDVGDFAYEDVFNKENFSFIERNYSSVFCHTDKSVFDIRKEYDLPKSLVDKVVFTGYVSRAYELEKIGALPKSAERFDRIVGSGCSVNGLKFNEHMLKLKSSYFPQEKWAIFLGDSMPKADQAKIINRAKKDESLDIILFSDKFLDYLSSCGSIITHGGYNLITDTLFFKKPVAYIARDVPERDQEIHLDYLKKSGAIVDYLSEKNLTEGNLLKLISTSSKRPKKEINLKGSEFVSNCIK